MENKKSEATKRMITSGKIQNIKAGMERFSAESAKGFIYICGDMGYAGEGGVGCGQSTVNVIGGWESRLNAAKDKLIDELNEFVSEMNLIIREATSCECESDSE